MDNPITFRMHVYYWRNKWMWFWKPAIQEQVARVIPKVSPNFRRRRRVAHVRWSSSRRQQAVAVACAIALAVVPNVAWGSAVASTSSGYLDGETQTLTATGTPPELNMDAIYKPQFIYPVGHVSIASAFGWRVSPCPGCSSDHNGVDFHVPSGTPILAAQSGTVIFTGWEGGLGYHIVIDGGYGFVAYYAHMIDRSIPAGIVVGSRVAMGDVVGLVGCTGACTGAHLHFGLQDEGVFVDPMSVLEKYAP